MKEQDLYFAVEDCYETDYSSKMEWKVSQNNDSNYLFIQTIVLTYISEYTTLLTCKYSFNMNSKVVKEQFVESEAIMKNYYYNIEKGINVRKYLMTNIAGIKINANMQFIFWYLTILMRFFLTESSLCRFVISMTMSLMLWWDIILGVKLGRRLIHFWTSTRRNCCRS